MANQPEDFMVFKKSSGAADRKNVREFCPARPALGQGPDEFKMSGGILGAIGGTPLVHLEKIFAPSHFNCFAKLESLRC